jgi:predicted amidophosphoribosyltransferase
LGSYALRRKTYIDGVEWADFINAKENDPDDLAEKMLPKFLDFFKQNKRFGVIHAITTAPRSKRNIKKPHVMDFLAQSLADTLGIEYVRFFEPWEKSGRGRFAKHGEITVCPVVSKYIGKVVWVLDDVTTTNFTLRSAVQSLLALEIHAHGLAYIYMA